MQNHMKNPQSMCSISFVSSPACPRNVLSYTSHNSRTFGCKMRHLFLYPFEYLSSSLQFTFLLFLAPTAYLLHKTDYGCPVIAAWWVNAGRQVSNYCNPNFGLWCHGYGRNTQLAFFFTESEHPRRWSCDVDSLDSTRGSGCANCRAMHSHMSQPWNVHEPPRRVARRMFYQMDMHNGHSFPTYPPQRQRNAKSWIITQEDAQSWNVKHIKCWRGNGWSARVHPTAHKN